MVSDLPKRAGPLRTMLVFCLLNVPSCALNFGTDPVGAPDAWGDPDVVDTVEAVGDATEKISGVRP